MKSVLMFLVVVSFASVSGAQSFGFGNRNSVQVDANAWLIDQPFYTINNEAFWIHSYSTDAQAQSDIDDAICKGLGFQVARAESRIAAAGTDLFASGQSRYNMVEFNRTGQPVKFYRELPNMVSGMHWKTLICEK